MNTPKIDLTGKVSIDSPYANAVLNENLASGIRALSAVGMRQSEIANAVVVRGYLVGNVVHGRSWK